MMHCFHKKLMIVKKKKIDRENGDFVFDDKK